MRETDRLTDKIFVIDHFTEWSISVILNTSPWCTFYKTCWKLWGACRTVVRERGGSIVDLAVYLEVSAFDTYVK